MNLTLKTPPTESEVLALLSVAKLKENLRIAYVSEDDFLKDCILEAYDWLAGEHGWLNRPILTSEWELTLPGFKSRRWTKTRDGAPDYAWVSSDVIMLPKPPVIAVSLVEYMVDGEYIPLEAERYLAVYDSGYGILQGISRNSWPTVDDHPAGVRITYTSGYGTAVQVKAKHPSLLRALKVLASDYFRNREDTVIQQNTTRVNKKIANGLERTAGRYRIPNA